MLKQLGRFLMQLRQLAPMRPWAPATPSDHRWTSRERPRELIFPASRRRRGLRCLRCRPPSYRVRWSAGPSTCPRSRRARPPSATSPAARCAMRTSWTWRSSAATASVERASGAAHRECRVGVSGGSALAATSLDEHSGTRAAHSRGIRADVCPTLVNLAQFWLSPRRTWPN